MEISRQLASLLDGGGGMSGLADRSQREARLLTAAWWRYEVNGVSTAADVVLMHADFCQFFVRMDNGQKAQLFCLVTRALFSAGTTERVCTPPFLPAGHHSDDPSPLHSAPQLLSSSAPQLLSSSPLLHASHCAMQRLEVVHQSPSPPSPHVSQYDQTIDISFFCFHQPRSLPAPLTHLVTDATTAAPHLSPLASHVTPLRSPPFSTLLHERREGQ
ncbi:hypothetical protein TcWFU_000616 [Taenia crassiceps]|uniref:Uncharacterized protein n=1 Tax=Taenia crassiceps TaxID=6207 RepID=A0ABR4QAC1_9CEST